MQSVSYQGFRLFLPNHVHAEKHRNNPCLDKKDCHKDNMDNGQEEKTSLVLLGSKIVFSAFQKPGAGAFCIFPISHALMQMDSSIYNVTRGESSFRSYLKSGLALFIFYRITHNCIFLNTQNFLNHFLISLTSFQLLCCKRGS